MKKNIIFLPGLNGIRTFAALGVMFSHITIALGKFNFDHYLFGIKNHQPRSWKLGEHGVTMFFVLSGFLITYLLLSEREKDGNIRIKDFYFRRMLRIWPLYYLYFFVCIVILYFIGKPVNFGSSIPYLYMFFCANIPFVLQKALLYLDHFWSIGVEEQFYLFWPWFFRMKENKLIYIILFFIILLSGLRIILWYYIPFSIPALFSVVNRFDCMLFGGLGAILYSSENKLLLKIVDNKISQFLALFILFLLIINKFHFLNAIIEIFVVELMTLVLIIGQINIKNRIINFNNSVMDYLGKLSYGIYVIHVLILNLVISYINWDYFQNNFLKTLLIYATIVSITIGLAHFSYNYFEKPFLKLKNKYASVKSSASKEFDTFKK